MLLGAWVLEPNYSPFTHAHIRLALGHLHNILPNSVNLTGFLSQNIHTVFIAVEVLSTIPDPQSLFHKCELCVIKGSGNIKASEGKLDARGYLTQLGRGC